MQDPHERELGRISAQIESIFHELKTMREEQLESRHRRDDQIDSLWKEMHRRNGNGHWRLLGAVALGSGGTGAGVLIAVVKLLELM